MSFLQKLHSFAGRIDPVVKFADKRNLTPSFLYPMETPTEKPSAAFQLLAAKAKPAPTLQSAAPPKKRASGYLSTTGSGMFGGGGG